MPLLSRNDAPVHRLPGITFTTLSAPSRGAAETSVWEVEVGPGSPGTPHRLTREETFIVLEGCAVAEVEGQRHELTPGSALVVPAGQTLSLANPGPRAFRAMAIFPVGGQVLMDGKPAFTPAWAA